MKPEDLMVLPVEELMTTDARVFSPADRVSTVIGFLRESNSYEAFVEEGERTSIVSVRDLLGLTSLDTKLSTLMRQVPRLNQNNTASDAASLMFEHRSRSVPIYRGKALVGQVTSPSIVSKLVDSSANMRLSAFMTPQPITVVPSSPISAARELMIKRKIDQVPVVNGNSSLVGIVTSDSLVFNMIPKADRDVKGDWQRGRYDESVGTYSEKSVTTNEITDPVKLVFRNMSKQKRNYSLIMNAGELQGIITYRDFMGVLAKRNLTTQTPMYIVGLPDDAFEAAMARKKFLEAIELMKRTFPEITEARAVIKSKDTGATKRRNEVKVLLLSAKRRYVYTVSSYELADAFDQIHAWAKKAISEHKPKHRRPTAEIREFPA